MQALQYLDAGRPELIEAPTPEPGPDEILVKVEAVTTCAHWDLHLMAGEPMFPGHQLKFPYSVGQPGHEALGEVAAVGDGVEGLAPGQRVVMWRDRGHDLPGCYAQYVVAIPEDALLVPSDLPDEKLASLELAMCVQVSFDQLERLGLVEGREMAVGGLGPAGLVAVQIAQAMGGWQGDRHRSAARTPRACAPGRRRRRLRPGLSRSAPRPSAGQCLRLGRGLHRPPSVHPITDGPHP